MSKKDTEKKLKQFSVKGIKEVFNGSNRVFLCEMVDEISDIKLSKYLSGFNHKKGMKFKRFNLEFFGICKKCKKD